MPRAAQNLIRVGISGWTYGPWRGVFYPEGLRQADELHFASREFSSIELNGSFYSLQYPSSYLSWYQATPEGFVFSIKGGRYITHIRRLKDVRSALANFFAVHRLPRQLEGGAWRAPQAGRAYYAFDWGPGRFVALDTNQMFPIPGAPRISPGSEQRRWLERELASSSARWKIVFLHIGPYSSGMHGGSAELAEWIAPLFEKHGVDVVFAGHDHSYERTAPIVRGRRSAQGPVYVTCGIGGAALRRRKERFPWTELFARRHGYVRVALEPGRLGLEAVGADGIVFDRWERLK